ncbi:protein of unknown function [Modestobacter italicus]|uniref:AB hydrolase-1 domain-containing protein n=1 Tax=Modestobacter italicus (strain DSM 44449 / CECT 9708 / BC 501) TaxID=2732864 RepID=I4EYE7_MODI5|nr:hypothetical protein [Modestobacter marinus]CCH88410.1 protein of unknown function [Modestobacter marinus]
MYGFEVWARDVLAVAAAADVDTPALVGSSTGSVACLVATTLQPGVRGLALIDTPIGLPRRDPGGSAPRECGYTPPARRRSAGSGCSHRAR